METALKGAILNHRRQTAALSAAQYGFIPHRVCLFNLLVAEERITWLMNSGEGVDLVYLDFAKAFDSVNHQNNQKMLAYGIHRSIVDWTRSFLSNRTFQVRVGESYSALVTACNGAP